LICYINDVPIDSQETISMLSCANKDNTYSTIQPRYVRVFNQYSIPYFGWRTAVIFILCLKTLTHFWRHFTTLHYV